MCYYFNDIIKVEDLDLDNVLIDEKSHENILIYDISYKTQLIQNLSILDLIKQMDLLELNDGTRYLTLLRSEKYEAIYNRIRYLIT